MRSRVNIKAQIKGKIAVLRGFCAEVEGLVKQRKTARKSSERIKAKND